MNFDELCASLGMDTRAIDRWVDRFIAHREPRWRRRRERNRRSTKRAVEKSARCFNVRPSAQRQVVRSGRDPWAARTAHP